MDDEKLCPYCGVRRVRQSAGSSCAVCGMAIPRGHWPHVLRFDADAPPVHLCSLACMDNYEALQEAVGDA